ncbi:MAG: hypothetical protein GX663_03410 [Clostridiales bacterium]|nr:hypothetical protein [Clostridiales bacterium]
MDRFRMWFANVMQGRYGTDELNKVLLVLAFALIAINWFVHMRIVRLLMVAALIIFYCRMMSRNYAARSGENQRWLAFAAKFRSSSGSRRNTGGPGGTYNGGSSRNAGSARGFSGFSTSDDPNHKILRCPGCGEKLRVPKGKGKIRIKCPHCNTEFEKKV